MSETSVCSTPRAAGNLRPYGEGGSLICFKCATTPEREKETRAQFDKAMDEAKRRGGIVVIGGDDGPRPPTWSDS